jgi:flagellar basal-body rod modification protein FlgD
MSGSIGATTATTTRSENQRTGLAADFDTFLTLLTTQLQNQDPSQPMDANELTKQLTEFAGVEQQIETNNQLASLISLQQAGQMAGSSSLLGQRATMATDVLPLQDGSATVNLPAAGTARTARIQVSDSAGRVLRSTDVPLGTGATAWQWDGRDQAGTQRADGAYRVTVSGRAADGSAVAIDSSVTARVTGVVREGDGLSLRFGTATIGYDRLRELPDAS